MDAATTTERDAEEALQAAHDLPMRQAGLLVEFDDSGLSIRSQLGRGGAEGVGCLQGVPPLDPTVALTTPTDVDVELAVNGLPRDFDLELLGGVGFVEGAAAVGAPVRQGRLVNLVDPLGPGRLAVSVHSVECLPREG